MQNSLTPVQEESNADHASYMTDTFCKSGIASLCLTHEPAINDRVLEDIPVNDLRYEEIVSPHSTQQEPNFHRANSEFAKRFLENEFGYACDVCARIWFKSDLKPIAPGDSVVLLATNYFETVEGFLACLTCRSSLKRGVIPTLSQTNGFTYPKFPTNLPPLDPLTIRLVSPRINFMQLRRLRHAAGLRIDFRLKFH